MGRGGGDGVGGGGDVSSLEGGSVAIYGGGGMDVGGSGTAMTPARGGWLARLPAAPWALTRTRSDGGGGAVGGVDDVAGAGATAQRRRSSGRRYRWMRGGWVMRACVRLRVSVCACVRACVPRACVLPASSWRMRGGWGLMNALARAVLDRAFYCT